jgi:D-methionine transport system ATP-binding protein
VIKEICERVAVIDHGSIVEQGSVFDVFTAPQSEVTRSLVRNVVDHELPVSLKDRLNDGSNQAGNPVLRIVFTGAAANHPIISEIVSRFGVMLNIMQGNVDYIQDAPYGNVVVEAIGNGANIQAAIEYIRSVNLRVEVIGHVAGFDRAVA